jgi:hypothetical protein
LLEALLEEVRRMTAAGFRHILPPRDAQAHLALQRFPS